MLYVGLDLSRQRLDVHVLDEEGANGRGPSRSPRRQRPMHPRQSHPVPRSGGQRGHRVHDRIALRPRHLERLGWEVAIADPVKAKGLAPLAAKTDKIDAHVLAELARRDSCPRSGCPSRCPRGARAGPLSLHLVRHRAVEVLYHATLMTFGSPPFPVTDLFGTSGRELLAGFELPSPGRGPWRASLAHARRTRRADRMMWARASPSLVPTTLHPAASDCAPAWAASRLHDRLRDRRHCPLREPQEAHRLHRVMSDRAPVGQPRRPWAVAKTARSTCAGPSSKPPPTPLAMSTSDRYERNKNASDASAAPRSPGSTSPVSWPRPSGMS